VVGTNTVIGGGFRLLREKPAAVAIWALVYAVLATISTVVLLPQLAGSGMMDPSGFDPETMREQGMAMLGAFIGSSFLFSLVQWFISAVLLCAAFRTALRPGEGGPGGLAIGMDELRLFGLMLLLTIGGIFAMVVAMLLVVLVTVVIGFLAQDLAWIAVLFAIPLWIGAFCAFIVALVRLSLAYPLTFLRGALSIDESWALTRGSFWSLFAAYLIIVLISVALSMIVALPVMGHQMAIMFEAMGDPERLRSLQAEQLRYQLDMPIAMRAVTIVAASVVHAVTLAIGAGALAAAAQALLAERGEAIGTETGND
jgi:hypothetical protein